METAGGPGDRDFVTKAIANRPRGFLVEVTYHSRRRATDVRVFGPPRFKKWSKYPPKKSMKKLKAGPLKDAIVMQYLIWRSTKPHGR